MDTQTRPDAPVASERRWECDVLTADGSPIHLRPIRPEDGPALVEFHGRLSSETVYYRFFSFHPELSPAEVERFTHVDQHDRVALVALSDEQIVGVGRYDRLLGTDDAEVALVVADAFQGRGIGTLLLEHLAVVGAAEGIGRFVAQVLPANRKMLAVFRQSGFEESARLAADVVEVVLPLTPTPAAIEAILRREHQSEARSIERLLHPDSVALVGASERPGTIGHALMTNLQRGGYAGPIYPVNPGAEMVAGLAAYPSVSDIPGPVDLAVVAVPAAAVEQVVRQCAAKHVSGLALITAGFAESGPAGVTQQQTILDLARSHGMRVVGPNCVGLANTAIGLDATFSPFPARPGRVGFLSQSGALGIALLERSAALDLGVSSFVSVGNKADVSGNDLLQYWEDDPHTDVVLLYLESFGNPRKFARLARRVSRRKPIIALKSGRSSAGRRAASSHTAAMASPDSAVDALFTQAGVIRVDTLTELFDTAMLLAWQPLPAGRRVAIVGNSGGPETMTCDACGPCGLDVAELGEATADEIGELVSLPLGTAVANPVDLLAGASVEQIEQATRALLADDGVDAVIVVVTPILGVTPDAAGAAIARAASGSAKPVLACVLAVPEPPDPLREARVPWYPSPEAAVRALARAADYATWRQRDPGVVPRLDDFDLSAVKAALTSATGGGGDSDWLPPSGAASLVEACGIEVAPTIAVTSVAEALEAATQVGYPVVVKLESPALVHKSDVGGVRLGLRGEHDVRRALGDMAGLVDGPARFVVQPMVDRGVEMIAGIVQDPAFGPLVMLGAGGITAELLADRAYRILPLTDRDAAEMVRSLRLSPLLFGYRGQPPAAVDRLEELLIRLAQLADQVPALAELDCNPVIVTGDSAIVVDAKARIAHPPPVPPDPRRRLR